MNATIVAKHVNNWFHNYDYKLFNSFMFAWECDFFAISGSGYAVEVEIKISRSDFKADFKKEKHRLFESVRAGKAINVLRRGRGDYAGDVLIRNFEEKRLCLRFTQHKGLDELIEHNWYSKLDKPHMQKRYVVNDWDFDRVHLQKRIYDVHAPASRIDYQVLSETKLPNQFYFAVPEGLITLDEVPDYAGLIYITDGGCKVIRKAPYLHKRKQDLRTELLQKFYNLWLYRVPASERLEAFVDKDAQPESQAQPV